VAAEFGARGGRVWEEAGEIPLAGVFWEEDILGFFMQNKYNLKGKYMHCIVFLRLN
jgi:hypothetical protein